MLTTPTAPATLPPANSAWITPNERTYPFASPSSGSEVSPVRSDLCRPRCSQPPWSRVKNEVDHGFGLEDFDPPRP